MRKRIVAVGLGVILGANTSAAQPPVYPTQPVFPTPPKSPQLPQIPIAPPINIPPPGTPPSVFPVAPVAPGSLAPSMPQLPQPPQPLPPSIIQPPGMNTPGAPANKPGPTTPGSPAAEMKLPHPEQKTRFSALDVQVKRIIGGWQVCAGQQVLRDAGANETDARDVARVLRDLRPTEWVTIGGPKPIVEYGLTNGRPAGTAAPSDARAEANGNGQVNQARFDGPLVTGAGAKMIQPIDMKTARVEAIRGVWCVRDDNNLLFNFGTDKASAEQTVAVIHKYGFNRVGIVGAPTQPVMSYLFSSLEAPPKQLTGPLLVNAQIDALTRTGIPIPGVGFAGEMVKIDPMKVEAKKDGAEWVVIAGTEVLGRFGATEWSAREAARTIRDARYTEFCKLGGTSEITFFLRDGKPPTRAPFAAQGRHFDQNSLKVQQVNGKWAVTENSKPLFDVGTQQEGEVVLRLLKAYGFDQTAKLTSGGSKGGIMFLVKNR